MTSPYLEKAKTTRNPEKRKRLLVKHRAFKLRSEMRSCERCALADSRTQVVPFSGNPPQDLAIIGEAPGANEDRKGKPFVGQAGKLLDDTLTEVGLSRREAIVFNTVSCRPPGNRNPETAEIEACRPWFDAQLRLSGAWVVLVLGAVALNVLRPGSRIGDMRGVPYWADGRVWYPTYHPAYALRSKDGAILFKEDLFVLAEIVKGDRKLPYVDPSEFDYDGGSGVGSLLREQGWVKLYSKRFREFVIYAANDSVNIPPQHLDLPKYTVEELARLGSISKRKELNITDLQRIHMMKKEFGAKVIA